MQTCTVPFPEYRTTLTFVSSSVKVQILCIQLSFIRHYRSPCRKPAQSRKRVPHRRYLQLKGLLHISQTPAIEVERLELLNNEGWVVQSRLVRVKAQSRGGGKPFQDLLGTVFDVRRCACRMAVEDHLGDVLHVGDGELLEFMDEFDEYGVGGLVGDPDVSSGCWGINGDVDDLEGRQGSQTLVECRRDEYRNSCLLEES